MDCGAPEKSFRAPSGAIAYPIHDARVALPPSRIHDHPKLEQSSHTRLFAIIYPYAVRAEMARRVFADECGVYGRMNQFWRRGQDFQEAQFGMIQVALAHAGHGAEAGTYPWDLAGLRPKSLPSLPTDPVSGEPFRYYRKDDGHVLYSVGVNPQDDNGCDESSHPQGDDHVIRVMTKSQGPGCTE